VNSHPFLLSVLRLNLTPIFCLLVPNIPESNIIHSTPIPSAADCFGAKFREQRVSDPLALNIGLPIPDSSKSVIKPAKAAEPISKSSSQKIETVDAELIDIADNDDIEEPGMDDFLLAHHNDHSNVKFIRKFEFLPASIEHEMGTAAYPNFDLSDAKVFRKAFDYSDLPRSIGLFLAFCLIRCQCYL
jgi:hypothetical protein